MLAYKCVVLGINAPMDQLSLYRLASLGTH